MIFHKTKIDGLYIIKPELKTDERGYLTRIFCKEELKQIGVVFDAVQISQTLTKKKGTIRGMHFQEAPKAEDKIIQCLKGAVYDVAIDLRKNSPTYGKWVSERLTEENKKLILIPKGFAHGFQTLTDNCEMQYVMSEFHSPEHANGVRWDDPLFEIPWPIANPLLSDKDKNWPLVKNKTAL